VEKYVVIRVQDTDVVIRVQGTDDNMAHAHGILVT
jgi:hypothetical protein